MSARTSSIKATDPWQSAASSSESSNLSGACALLALLVQTQSICQSGAKTDVELGAQKLEELKKQLADAIRQAEEAADQSGFLGFLGDVFGNDIAQIAGAVASLAATVATGGAAAPLLIVTLSAALQAGAKLGAELGLDPELCMALSIASVAVGFASGPGAGQAASTLANAARYVEVGGKTVQGSAVIAGGALHYGAAQYRADELNYQADAVGQRANQTATQLGIDDAFALLARALRAEQRTTSSVSQIIQNNADASAALCSRI